MQNIATLTFVLDNKIEKAAINGVSEISVDSTESNDRPLQAKTKGRNGKKVVIDGIEINKKVLRTARGKVGSGLRFIIITPTVNYTLVTRKSHIKELERRYQAADDLESIKLLAEEIEDVHKLTDEYIFVRTFGRGVKHVSPTLDTPIFNTICRDLLEAHKNLNRQPNA